MKSRSKSSEAKFNSDFIPTISDSESDVPDLDSEDEKNDDQELIGKESTGDSTGNSSDLKISKAKKKSKSKAKSKSKTKTKGSQGDEESDAELTGENQVAKDLNPDFVFSVEDFGSTAIFDGWDFGLDGDKGTNNGETVRKDIDLDDIIRRKGGLSGKIDISGKDEEDESAKDDHSKEEDSSSVDSDNDTDSLQGDDNDSSADDDNAELDDDELALDGFGMGAADTTKANEDIEDAEDKSTSAGNDLVPLEKDDDDEGENNSDDEADSAEAIAKYYDEEEGVAAKQQAHKTFQSLQLSRPILKALSALNYSTPTPIQAASIPIALLGRDIVAGAVTGSGKTAAYIIPIIERLLYKPAKIAKTRVIVLTPTRELAIQVADVGRKLGQFVQNLSFGLAVGGLNLRQQEQELKKRPDIVIATPGRLIDHIRNSPSFSVDDVEIVVMDEADRMLEEGFEKEMQEIVELLPRKRQTMLFSATMNSSIKQLIAWSLQKPVRIMIDPPKTAASGLMQEFVRIRKRDELKPALLYTILSKLDPKQRVIIFISTKDMCHKLRIKLGLLGLRVGELHGGLSQEQRLKSVTLFKNSTVPVLLCTDLAARGLDIPKIEVVVNYDMPKTHEIYLHRVGRTARAGRDGLSISFVGEAKRERAIVREVVKNVEESKKGKVFGRNADWDEVDRVNAILESKKDLIQEIIDEENTRKRF